MPIYLNLQGRPGMPKGAQGGIFLNVPISPNVPSCEPVAPQPPTDVLHGNHADGNTLTGIGGGNLLRSTDPTGTVTVESIK